ncbi:MAG: aminopeptidase, partial [Cetobacterium sp.]
MLFKKENGWKQSGVEKELIFEFCKEYKVSLDKGKTEREYVNYSLQIAKENGFVSAESKKELVAGDKVYYLNREKN